MKPLYEIEMELQVLMSEAREHAIENEGEISEELSDKIDKMNLDREQKIKNLVHYIKNKKAEINMITEEVKAITDRFDTRKKAIDREVNYLTNYLSRFLRPKEKVKDATFSVSWRNSTKPEIPDDIYPEDLDKEYTRTKVSFDRTAISKALKAGKNVYPGIILVSKDNIQIK